MKSVSRNFLNYLSSKSARHALMLFLSFFIVFLVALFPYQWQESIYRASISLLFIASLLNIEKYNRLFITPVLIAVGIQWAAAFLRMEFLEMTSKILNFLFFLYMTGYFIREIVKAKVVTSKVLFQAIIGYLLLGIIFAVLITALLDVDPGMYNFSDLSVDSPAGGFSEILYYTFVTLNTVGYGDILPMHPYSRSLAVLISVTGPMYLTIIIAMLVGKYSARD